MQKVINISGFLMANSLTNADDIIKYAIPLLSLKNKSHSDICHQYSELFLQNPDNTSQYLSQVWILLSMTSGDLISIAPNFISLVQKMPKIKIYVIFFLWLSKIYDFTGKNSSNDVLAVLFRFLRCGDHNGFFEYLQKDKNQWKPVIFDGAFSPKSYKRWRELALEYIESKSSNENEKKVLKMLCGNKDVLNEFSLNFFDRLWTELYCMITDAMSGTLNTDFVKPKPENEFEKLALLLLNSKILKNQFDDIYNDKDVPLIMKIHMSIVFGHINMDILDNYIDLLADNYLLEHIIFYSSLSQKENALNVIARICSGLPEPDQRVIDSSQKFGLEPCEVASSIASYTINSKINDFIGTITKEGLLHKKILSLNWMKLANATNELKLQKTRELLSCLVIDNEFSDANLVFKDNEGLFNNRYEKNCWSLLFETENRYNKWKNETKEETEPLIKLLYEIIKYPFGWMKKAKDVDQSVGKHCIPMVVYQLFEVLENIGEYEKALGIVCLLCDSRQIIHAYFNKNEMINLLMKVKHAAIGKYRLVTNK